MNSSQLSGGYMAAISIYASMNQPVALGEKMGGKISYFYTDEEQINSDTAKSSVSDCVAAQRF